MERFLKKGTTTTTTTSRSTIFVGYSRIGHNNNKDRGEKWRVLGLKRSFCALFQGC